MSSTPADMDLDQLVAIDVHVHVEQDLHGHKSMDEELLDAASKYFKGDPYHPTVPQIAEDYQSRDMAAAHPDALIPFGSIDPARGVSGVRAARRLVTEHGVRGFKFHPSIQAFEPNDPKVYPLYEELQSLGVPALFHTGQTGIGAGLPGGAGSSCATPTRCSTTWPPTSRA